MAPPRLTGKDWPRIRHDYEETDKPNLVICAEHGISASTLRNRVRQWNWTPRRPPVPAQGPPLPEIEAPPIHEAPLVPSGPASALAPAAAAPVSAADMARYAAAAALLAERPVRLDDAALMVPRLQSAIARMLPAIEVTLAQLASVLAHPREVERAARTLAGLTRTLRELNAMLNQYPAAKRDEDDEFFAADLQKLERMAVVSEAYRRGILKDD
ncbi:MAG: hypothetical protein E6G97_09295 [Alphaproteobacteria bacterium]|nr:MAG: hypothetical protein E6G97_09295 [Alphaproteobacteria bacterium]